MSNALPHWHYRDPAEVLQRKQENKERKSCNGCSFEDEILMAGKPEKYCLHGNRHGKRCNFFKLKDVNENEI